MSEFLLVVPDGWTEVTNLEQVFSWASPEAIQLDIAQELWYEIEQAMDFAGVMPAEHMILDAKLFDGGSGWRLWVRIAPIG
jgi:hypothetical protein